MDQSVSEKVFQKYATEHLVCSQRRKSRTVRKMEEFTSTETNGAARAEKTPEKEEQESKTDTQVKSTNQKSDRVMPSDLKANSKSQGTHVVEHSEGPTGNCEAKKLSKNQLKRQRKWAQAMEVKRRRKEQEKNIKIAKAKAEGRDIEAERRDMEERRKEGSGWNRRNDRWKDKFEQNSSKYQVCLDCSFETSMTSKEVNSLASQIRYCYAFNKRAKHPVNAKVTSLTGATLGHLQNVSGFEQWANRAFEHTEQDLLEAYPDTSKLVYLTSDSNNILDTLEDGKVYIVGGIVDRNRLKRAAINRAEELGIATAKLPIDDHLHMVTTKVLTCNHMFEILLKYREHKNDWKKTLLDVLPIRKDAKDKQS